LGKEQLIIKNAAIIFRIAAIKNRHGSNKYLGKEQLIIKNAAIIFRIAAIKNRHDSNK
jgi:hypothetical protein